MNTFKKIVSVSLLLVSMAPVAAMAQTTASGTPTQRQAQFCSMIDSRVGNIETKVGDLMNQISGRMTDRFGKLADQWSEFEKNRSDNRAKQDATVDADIAKLEAKFSTDSQKSAIVAFQTAVKNALQTRRSAVDAALVGFKDGVTQALKTRDTAVQTSFTARTAALKAAVDKAKADCASGVAARTIRDTFIASTKSAQQTFVTARKSANDTFQSSFANLKNARKSAVDSAEAAFKTSVQAAREALKAALGTNASSSGQ